MELMATTEAAMAMEMATDMEADMAIHHMVITQDTQHIHQLESDMEADMETIVANKSTTFNNTKIPLIVIFCCFYL